MSPSRPLGQDSLPAEQAPVRAADPGVSARDPVKPAFGPAPRLFRTTAMRMALRYAAVYALVMGTALAAVRLTTGHYVDSQLEESLERELAMLIRSRADDGIQALAAILARRAQADQDAGRFSLLVSSQGAKLAGNLRYWPRESELVLDRAVRSVWIEDNAVPIEVEDDEVYWPVIATELPDGQRLLLARRVEQASALHDFTEYLFEFLSAAMALALVMSMMVGRAILKRMDTIGRAASEIMAGDLSRRVPVSPRNDEFDALAARLNALLDRIQHLIRGMREVTDNVAHDLRRPLARLRNRFEVTLLEPREAAEYREALQRGIEDTEALIGTFNALLLVAQAEAGHRRAQWEPVSLNRLARDLAELYAPLAEEKNQRLQCFEGPDAEIHGGRDLLAQAISNLVENAIHYTPEHGSIRLQVGADADSATISVADTGPGIPAAERSHVLERFVRLEASRHTPGAGLGLSLVRAVAQLHGAELTLADAGPGLIARLRFPRLKR